MRRTTLYRFLFILFLQIFLLAGCGHRSKDTPLDQFAGEWKSLYTILDEKGARISSGTLAVKQLSADTVGFRESSSIVAGIGPYGVPRNETRSFEVSLKGPDSAGKYALYLKIDSQDVLTDFLLSYSQVDGFVGQSSVTINGKQQPVTASIKKKDEGGYIWAISTPEGIEPKLLYEFQFKERSNPSTQ